MDVLALLLKRPISSRNITLTGSVNLLSIYSLDTRNNPLSSTKAECCVLHAKDENVIIATDGSRIQQRFMTHAVHGHMYDRTRNLTGSVNLLSIYSLDTRNNPLTSPNDRS